MLILNTILFKIIVLVLSPSCIETIKFLKTFFCGGSFPDLHIFVQPLQAYFIEFRLELHDV